MLLLVGLIFALRILRGRAGAFPRFPESCFRLSCGALKSFSHALDHVLYHLLGQWMLVSLVWVLGRPDDFRKLKSPSMHVKRTGRDRGISPSGASSGRDGRSRNANHGYSFRYVPGYHGIRADGRFVADCDPA